MTSLCTGDGTVTIVDYGAGNLHSLAKALAFSGARIRIDDEPRRAVDRSRTSMLVLPGVGAFSTAAARIAPARHEMRRAIDDGLPVLGVCLGMQLLFDSSEEGSGAGLSVIPGTVRRLDATRVPQIGWNTVERAPNGQRLGDEPLPSVAYYANSFVCEPENEESVIAWSCYEQDRFPAAVRGGPLGNIIGVQFHPEKSSAAGRRFLHALVAWALETARR